MSYVMTYKTKANLYCELERIRCAIRGDRMTPNIHFDGARSVSHMPSQAGRRLLVAAVAAEGYEIQSWDLPGAYMKAPNDPLPNNNEPTAARGWHVHLRG